MLKSEQETSEAKLDEEQTTNQAQRVDSYTAFLVAAMGQANMSRERADALLMDDEKPNE